MKIESIDGFFYREIEFFLLLLLFHVLAVDESVHGVPCSTQFVRPGAMRMGKSLCGKAKCTASCTIDVRANNAHEHIQRRLSALIVHWVCESDVRRLCSTQWQN